MTSTHLAILFLTLFSFPSFAQKHELGKVTMEELNEKKCPLDPVDFEYPNQEKLNVNLMIPEGYAVELLPEPKNLSMKDSLANFKYNAIKNGNQIQIACTFDINRAIIGPQHYEALKAFYKEIVDKQTEKIVLKKV
ncbi:hypothetical protein [Flavobacterium sp.]